MDLDAISSVLIALSAIPWWAVLSALLGLFGWLSYSLYSARTAIAQEQWVQGQKNERATRFTAALDNMSNAVSTSSTSHTAALSNVEKAIGEMRGALSTLSASNDAFIDTQLKLSAAVEQLVESQNETADAVKALVATQRGAMSAEDTRRLVLREMDSLRKEVTLAFRESLRKNHYAEEPAKVEHNLKRGLREQFDKTLKILSGYNLAIRPNEFLETVPSKNGAHYTLIDKLWNEIRPLYLEAADYTSRTIAQEQDRRTADGVKSVFRTEYDTVVKRTLSKYIRDPETSGYPVVRPAEESDRHPRKGVGQEDGDNRDPERDSGPFAAF